MSKHIHTTTVTVDVDVDIDTDDLDDDELLEICEERGLLTGGVNKELIDELVFDFKRGRDDIALKRIKQFVQDAKGIVL